MGQQLGLFERRPLALAPGHEQRPDTALKALATRRSHECVARGLPATVERCVALLVENAKRGSPGRGWEVMTPTRYVHAADLLRAGVPPNIVIAAVDRINASGWLQRPVAEVTDGDLQTAAALAAESGVAA